MLITAKNNKSKKDHVWTNRPRVLLSRSSLDIEIDKLEMENITKLLNINIHLYLLNHDR